MTVTAEESLSKELFFARLLPTLLLIVIPFGMGIALPYLFPIFHMQSSFFYLTGKHEKVGLPHFVAYMVPAGIIGQVYRGYPKEYFFKKRGYETAINEYDYINKVLYIDLVILVILTLFFYILPQSMKVGYLSLLFGDGFFFLQNILGSTIYLTFLFLSYTYYRRDFRLELAKACMSVVDNKKDEINKVYYLMLGLDSYNKFLQRNLKLQFDKALVCSKIISSNEKNRSINLITASLTITAGAYHRLITCISNSLPSFPQMITS